MSHNKVHLFVYQNKKRTGLMNKSLIDPYKVCENYIYLNFLLQICQDRRVYVKYISQAH